MNGLEMMLGSMFKSMNIDPAELMKLAGGVGEGVKMILTQQKQILAQQATIIDQLEQLGAKPKLLPQPEDIDNDGHDGKPGHGDGHNGAGNGG